MMKILAIILLLSSLNTSCQTTKKTNDSIVSQETLSTDTKKPNFLSKKDTLKLGIETDKREISIQFIEPKKTDYFKYIFPILTLLLGIGVNRFIDYITKRKKIKKTAKRWLIEIQSLNDPLKRQVESIDEFLETHKKDEFTIPNLKVETHLDCESFKSLDKTELLKFLESFKKIKSNSAIKDVNMINSYITVVRHHFETLKEKFLDYKNGSSFHVTNLSKHLQDLLKAFAFYGTELKEELQIDPSNDPRYEPLLDLFESEIKPYMQNGDYDIFKLEKDFFMPLLSNLADFRFDKRTYDMTEAVQNSIIDIKGIKMEKSYLTTNFENIKAQFESNRTELKGIYELIE